MFTVFIADDEAKVISGLIHRVNWKKVDSCVIGYADMVKKQETEYWSCVRIS